MTQQTERDNYSQVVHHANVSASVSYVKRKTGLSYTLVGELMELALKNGDIAKGDYAGRKIEHYQDDRVAKLQARISELEAALESKAQDVQMPEPVGVAFTFETEEGGPLASQVTSSPSNLPMGWCRLYTEQQVRALLSASNSAEFDGVKAAERVPLTEEQADALGQSVFGWTDRSTVALVRTTEAFLSGKLESIPGSGGALFALEDAGIAIRSFELSETNLIYKP